MIHTYTPEEVDKKSSGGATLRISKDNGFYFSLVAIELLDLKAGDHLVIKKQTEDKAMHPATEYYLVKQEEGFELRDAKRSLSFFSKKLARIILDENKIAESAVTVKIASEPVKLEDGTTGHCMLMASALKSDRRV